MDLLIALTENVYRTPELLPASLDILAIIFGCGFGFGLPFALTGLILYKLHDNGNSTGGFYDFSGRHLTVLTRHDRIR